MGCWKPKANGRCSPMPIFPPPSAKSRSFGAHWLTSRLRPPWDRARWTGLWWAYTSPGCAKRWAAFSTQRCAWSRDFHSRIRSAASSCSRAAPAVKCSPASNWMASASTSKCSLSPSSLAFDRWKSRDHAHRCVENAAHRFAQPGLVYAHQRPVHRARSHGGLSRLVNQCAPKLLDFADGGGKIGIGEQRPFAFGFQHPMLHAVAFAAIPGVLQHAHSRLASHLNGIVGGAVVHHHHLGEFPGRGAEVLPHFHQGGG